MTTGPEVNLPLNRRMATWLRRQEEMRSKLLEGGGVHEYTPEEKRAATLQAVEEVIQGVWDRAGDSPVTQAAMQSDPLAEAGQAAPAKPVGASVGDAIIDMLTGGDGDAVTGRQRSLADAERFRSPHLLKEASSGDEAFEAFALSVREAVNSHLDGVELAQEQGPGPMKNKNLKAYLRDDLADLSADEFYDAVADAVYALTGKRPPRKRPPRKPDKGFPGLDKV